MLCTHHPHLIHNPCATPRHEASVEVCITIARAVKHLFYVIDMRTVTWCRSRANIRSAAHVAQNRSAIERFDEKNRAGFQAITYEIDSSIK